MAPLAPKYLKRKYQGTYQANKKFRRTLPLYNNVVTAPAPKRVELKYDIGQVNQLVTASGNINLLSTIANGTDVQDRIGRKISYHDIEIVWDLTMSASHSLSNHKMWIIFDNAPNGANPVWSDIFTSTVPYTLMNADQKGRFKVICEEEITTQDSTGATFARCWFENVHGHKVLSLKGKMAQFIGTSAGIASIDKGAIYMCVISDTAGSVTVNLQNKIQYSDA